MIKYILILLCFLSFGCGNERKSEELKNKEAALNQKEQELNQKQQALQLQEEALRIRQQQMDSSSQLDSAKLINPALSGSWTVQMTCTETTCSGSAVGDTKTESWNLSYQGNALIAQALANGQLVRTYTGFYTGNTIELVESRDTANVRVKMVVRLHTTDDSHLEGQREITRENCKVIYDLKLEKNG